MTHYWQNIDGTFVLINSNDHRSILAYINESNGVFLLKTPYLKTNVDLTDNTRALEFTSLSKAKKAAIEEIQRRIDEFVSPGN